MRKENFTKENVEKMAKEIKISLSNSVYNLNGTAMCYNLFYAIYCGNSQWGTRYYSWRENNYDIDMFYCACTSTGFYFVHTKENF